MYLDSCQLWALQIIQRKQMASFSKLKLVFLEQYSFLIYLDLKNISARSKCCRPVLFEKVSDKANLRSSCKKHQKQKQFCFQNEQKTK